jgi:hypothetical protein
MDIPWDTLGIPDSLRASVNSTAPRALRLAGAKGMLPATGEALLGTLYVLACEDDVEIRAAAVETLKGMPGLEPLLTQRTHPKVLELIAVSRPDPALDERIMFIRNANDRTATVITSRAGAALCEQIAQNHERLLMSPEVLVALHQNPHCGDAALERAVSFLRMQQSLPDLPPTPPTLDGRPLAKVAPASASGKAPAAPPPAPVFDLEAEIEAALAGKVSPHLEQRRKLDLFDLDKVEAVAGIEGFRFDFNDDDNFSMDLLEEGGDGAAENPDDADLRANVEKRIAAMSVGKKLKLAYLGNKTVRSVLIRDRNKMVSTAVVKSGRLTDAEVLVHAGNRNLPDEALREIATNKEWTRKYPVKVALVNNPKCPPSVAVGLVNHLQVKDLAALGRNRNVSSVVFGLATKLAKQKSEH